MRIAHWLFLLFLVGATEIQAQTKRCGAEDVLKKHFSDSELEAVQKKNRRQIAEWIAESQTSVRFRKVITIPVVVHVVWNTEEENISDEQIFSQIDILNADFRALNSEIPEIQSEFQHLKADIEIEFCLANIAPDGNPTNGITRTKTSNTFFSFGSDELYNSNRGGKTGWSSKDYINIWVANSRSVLGHATFPNVGNIGNQGIAIKYNCFGNIGAALTNTPFHLGRTATHEMGHFFNIQHLFSAKEDDCRKDNDEIADTPVSERSYSGQCPTDIETSCGSPDMYQNFLNYTDDACMALFTKGQKEVMLAALNLYRPHLITSIKCQGTPSPNSDFEFTIYPNPTNNSIRLKTKSTYFPKGDLKVFDAIGKLMIDAPNHATRNVLSVEKLESGVYFLEFRSGENRQVLKFVKI